MEFKKYRRTQVAEMRPVTSEDIAHYELFGSIFTDTPQKEVIVSISQEDRKAGSPKIGDMIARNPKNHADQWLVAEQYFKDNFEKIV